MTLFEKIKNMSIEEMADFVKPMYNECYECKYEKVTYCEECINCTDEYQRNNIIKILNSER